MTALIVGLEGMQLRDEEAGWLARSEVAGVILFRRNCAEPAQVRALTTQIRKAAPDALITIDQEGGRVRRLVDGFTALPALGALREGVAPDEAQMRAYWHGWLMAAETLSVGVDLSFAPVLDVDGISEVIGDRAFSPDADEVIDLGTAYLDGMRAAGMRAVGKHFPGHGSIAPDTHTAAATDARSLAALEAADLRPFVALASQLGGLMFAHVCYPCLSEQPAGFAAEWVRYARSSMGFQGALISDDLAMTAAHQAGNMAARLRSVAEAGMDIGIACRPADAELALTAGVARRNDAVRHLRPARRWTPAEFAAADERRTATRRLGLD